MNRSGTRFILVFIGLLVGFYLLIALPWVNDHVIIPFTRGVTIASAALLNLFGQKVEVYGTSISSPRFAVDIENGCNGLEAVLLLLAGMLAFPASWKAKLAGLAAGFAIVQGVNLIRVASLYWLGLNHPKLFQMFHTAIWQIAIILVSLGVFITWSRRFGAPADPAGSD